MDLWIRSQDKKILMLINTVALAEDEVGSIIGYGIDGRVKTLLGTYETEERALEVLDEIQKMDFAKNENVKLTNYGYVYEMPKE